MTEKEIKKIRKIFERNEKLFARNKIRYEKGIRREVKRTVKILKKLHIENNDYVPYAQDVYHYMQLHSQYPVRSVKQVEQILNE